jgi:multidrug efflux pump subunit AcrA (membrane-fusion protein)
MPSATDSKPHPASKSGTNLKNSPSESVSHGTVEGQEKSGSSESGFDDAQEHRSPPSTDFDPSPVAPRERPELFILINIAIPILLVLAGVLIVMRLDKAEAKTAAKAPPTRAGVLESLTATRVQQIESLKSTGEQLQLVVDGTVVPYREAQVSSEVAGRVIFKADRCEAGAIVAQGELLMRIDPTDYELDVERLERQLDQAAKQIKEVEQELINTQRSIEIAKEDVKLQQKEVDRQKALKRFASESEVDRARSALLQASQQLLTLENQLDLLRTRKSSLEASEQLAATQLRVAEVNLKRCEITAPISGVIVSEQADLNTFVNRGTPLVTIEDTTRVEVAANMRMDQLQWVVDQEKGNARSDYDLPDTPAIIEYELAGREGAVRRWKGTLVSYDGIGIDPNTRTVPVRIIVDDPTTYVDASGKKHPADRTNALLRGMFVRVSLQLTPQSDLVVVPATALRPGNRVWKFTPDDSVLTNRLKQQAEEFAESGAESAVQPRESAEDLDSDSSDAGEKFDPAAWTPGRVTFSDRVFPIESINATNSSAEQAEMDFEVSSAMQSPERKWVCQVGDTDLKHGDYVVVSPLNSIPPQGLPARAELSSPAAPEAPASSDASAESGE